LSWSRGATTSERLAAERIAANAEIEDTLRLLPAESRMSASVVLDFERNERPTPEQSAAVGRLQANLAKDPRGGSTDLVIQVPVVGGATGPGRAAYNFIQGWQQYTGKQVIFVASGTDQPLPFTGIVKPSDPNAIFLDVAGDRNVLALLGHEWAHTLALTNRQLGENSRNGNLRTLAPVRDAVAGALQLFQYQLLAYSLTASHQKFQKYPAPATYKHQMPFWAL
jgi:hypothetical protein